MTPAPLLALLAVLAAPVRAERCYLAPQGCFAYGAACAISACSCVVQCGHVVHPTWVRGRTCECP